MRCDSRWSGSSAVQRHEHGVAGQVIFDPASPFRVRFHNRAFQALCSEPARSRGAVGMALADCVPAELRGVLAVFEDVARTREAQSLADLAHDEPDGTRRSLDWCLSPIVVDNRVAALGLTVVEASLGRVAALVNVTRDVTDRKDVEAALRASHAKLEAFLASMNDAVFIFDTEGRLVEHNEAFARYHRFPSKAACPRTLAEYPVFLDVFLPDGTLAPLERWAISRALRGERATCVEYTLRRKDTGETWTGSYSFAPIRDERGAVVGAVATARDVTERRRAQDELAFRASVLAQVHDAIVAMDSDLRVTYMNGVAEQMFGWTLQEAFGLRADQVIGCRPEAMSKLDYHAALLRTGTFECEMGYRHRDGTGFSAEVRCSLLHDSAGNRKGTVVSIRDITDRKRAEVALREAEEHKRAEAELRAAHEALVEADHRKNGFLSVLSHELRNPLASIRNSLEILERAGAGSEKPRKALDIIERQTRQLSRLVDDLLDLTRLNHGKIHLQKGPVELNDLARKTAEDYRSLLESNGVRLCVYPSAGALPLEADAARLAQILGNLLHNASKFTPAGGRVEVRLDEDDAAVLRVRDTGAGIHADALGRVFEPFAQGERTLGKSRTGLGLGLSLVKGLVELHGGTVSAFSEGEGKGAEFVVRLPLGAAGTALSPPSPKTRVAALQRVLIIEDNADAADSLCNLLEMDGHSVEVAGDGEEGLALARRFHPDLVLCDIGLPGMDGFAVARVLRADPTFAGIQLVALSGYVQAEDVDRAYEAGFDAHVAKPPKLEEIERLFATPAADRPPR